MNPQDMSASDEALQNVNNPLKVMQPGERVICEIKRHPFGLVGMYGMFIFVVLLAITAVVASPKLISGITPQGQAAVALGGVIIGALTGLFAYVSSAVYKGNRWIVTTDSITQITQVSLFRKQTSQLSLANLEDVTVEQNGVIQSLFGFGRLRCETAGERSKFVFDYCPNPSQYAKSIINAHETYIAEKPGEMHISNRSVANAAAFNQSYAGLVAPGQQGAPYGPPSQQSQPYEVPQQYDQGAQPPTFQGDQSGQWQQSPEERDSQNG